MKITLRLKKHTGFGLSAIAVGVPSMRTVIYFIYTSPTGSQLLLHMLMNIFKVRYSHFTSGNTRLIRNNDHSIAVLFQQTDRFFRSGNPFPLMTVFNIVGLCRFLINHAISIKNHRFFSFEKFFCQYQSFMRANTVIPVLCCIGDNFMCGNQLWHYCFFEVRVPVRDHVYKSFFQYKKPDINPLQVFCLSCFIIDFYKTIRINAYITFGIAVFVHVNRNQCIYISRLVFGPHFFKIHRPVIIAIKQYKNRVKEVFCLFDAQACIISHISDGILNIYSPFFSVTKMLSHFFRKIAQQQHNFCKPLLNQHFNDILQKGFSMKGDHGLGNGIGDWP
eukprot:Opistho-2@2640